MAELSDHDCDIIAKHPLSDSLYRLQGLLQEAEQKYSDTTDPRDEICQQAISKLLTTLMGERAAFKLGSRTGDENLASDLASIFRRLQQGHLHLTYDHCRALARLVIYSVLINLENMTKAPADSHKRSRMVLFAGSRSALLDIIYQVIKKLQA
ncbi:predicted protein [Histoplasma mississippiense (nom. inval.)]|uniref:predicted protein n=1 Tax=Ajellomyces capsulatus (strain NAm1 / WU24) TaxID=2059318 RepID=UPI000157CFD9|nr:predicted protein [Histoplasma mississippiense (nom. inval.)]EDN10993.1 predicted protein [Histoplasma mississippiense (nom. inval.)]